MPMPFKQVFLFFVFILAGIAPAFSSPAAAASTIDDYGNLPSFERAAISPDGKLTAVITNSGSNRVIVIYSGDKVVKKVSAGDAKLRDIEWATNDLLMVDMSQTQALTVVFTASKTEFFRTLFISASDKETELLFKRQRDITPATFGWYGIRKIDGKDYGFFGGIRMVRQAGSSTSSRQAKFVFEGGSPELFRVDLSNFTAKKVAARARDDEYRTWMVGADGEVASTLNWRNSGDWTIINGAGKILVAGKNPDGDVGLVAFGQNGDTLIFRDGETEADLPAYFEIPLAGGERKKIFENVDLDGLFRERLTGKILGYRKDDEKRSTVFFNPVHDKNIKKIAKAFPKLNVHLRDWDDGLKKVLASTKGNEDSGTWWEVNLVSPSATAIGYERPRIYPKDVGAISVVDYKAADGLDLDGILTLPPGREAKNLPVIMLPHGGPRSRDRPTFSWWAQAMASQGYAVFQPNFRGSTNRDMEFVRAGYGEWGKKMQTDISDGLSHLAKEGIVDPNRACIMGASYGGYAALAGVTLQQGLYRCAVSVAGVSDLPKMVGQDIQESGNDRATKRMFARTIGKGADLKEVSPNRFAEKADAPILLIHGKDDIVVPYNQTRIMANELKDAGKPYELVRLDGEDHWLSRSETRLKMLRAAVDFVKKHNPPDPAPAKK